MPNLRSISVLTFLCLSLMLSGSCIAGAAEGTGASTRVSSLERLFEGNQAAPLSEIEEERAVTEQLDKLRANPRERRRLIMIAQMLLGRFGYGVGPFDGRFDDKMRRAVKYYQESNRLPGTGELDYPTLKQLTQDADWLTTRGAIAALCVRRRWVGCVRLGKWHMDERERPPSDVSTNDTNRM